MNWPAISEAIGGGSPGGVGVRFPASMLLVGKARETRVGRDPILGYPLAVRALAMLIQSSQA